MKRSLRAVSSKSSHSLRAVDAMAAESNTLQRRSIFRSISLYANVTSAKRKMRVSRTRTFRLGTVWWVSTLGSTMVVKSAFRIGGG
jgi:hypothetical protein